MTALDIPKLVRDSSYAHIESFAQAVGWQLDFRQIDAGPLESRVTEFGTPSFRVVRVEFDRSFHQLGRPPRDVLTFGLPDPSAGTLRWRGHETPSSVLINFNYEQQLDAVNPPGQFGGYVLHLEPWQLSAIGERVGCEDDLTGTVAEKGFWISTEGSLERLRDLLDALTTIARREGSEGLQRWSDVFSNDLATLLGNIVAASSYAPQLRAPPFRAAALNRAIEILSHYEQMPDNVDALCQLAGCSWDTLKRAFREEFGLSPKAYMKSRRLVAVQVELVKLGKDATIADVANKWGFWHMGSFAADYRKQFGELPSATLKRLAQSPQGHTVPGE